MLATYGQGILSAAFVLEQSLQLCLSSTLQFLPIRPRSTLFCPMLEYTAKPVLGCILTAFESAVVPCVGLRVRLRFEVSILKRLVSIKRASYAFYVVYASADRILKLTLKDMAPGERVGGRRRQFCRACSCCMNAYAEDLLVTMYGLQNRVAHHLICEQDEDRICIVVQHSFNDVARPFDEWQSSSASPRKARMSGFLDR